VGALAACQLKLEILGLLQAGAVPHPLARVDLVGK
jgi:hypothetical protein